MGFVDVAAVLVGIAGAVWLVTSAVRTVVIPRPDRVWMTATSFELARRVSESLGSRMATSTSRHRVLGAFAPSVLISLPLAWSLGLIVAFASIFWGLDVGSLSDAFELSGSSLTTLGFVAAPTLATRLVAIVEALFGLAIVALMISFLPTLYATFSRREIAVGRLTTRAGEPPDPVEFIIRLDAIDRLHHVGDRWDEWEDWFVELGETHTTFPALIYFRSARAGRSWLSAAETALDTAALLGATELVPRTGQADTMIRSGYLALRAIAEFYGIEGELDPGAVGELSVSREDFERVLDELEGRGIAMGVEREGAWRSYRGWRVNYDNAVRGLRELISDEPSHWTRKRPGSVV